METLILDIGCGDRPRGNVNLDINKNESKHFYEKNRRVNPKETVNFVCGDASHLPFKSNIFQKVLCHHTLEHLTQPNLAVEEMVRVANGTVEIVVPWRFCERIHNRFLPCRRRWAEKHHKHFFDKKQLQTIIGDTGIVKYEFRLFKNLRIFRDFRLPFKQMVFYGLLGTFLPPLPELKATIH